MSCDLFVKTQYGAVAMTMSVDPRTREITELSVDEETLEPLLVILAMGAGAVEAELIKRRSRDETPSGG